jgi:ribosome biogenesis protein UTP30
MVAIVVSTKSKDSEVSRKKSKGKKEQRTEAINDDDGSERVNQELLTKAVTALLKHHESQTAEGDKEQLLGNDTSIQVQITLHVAPVQPTRKPFIIDIPHPIYHVSEDDKKDVLESPNVCLFVKTESKAEVKEMIDQFPEQMGFVKKVMGLDSLRKKYAQYSQRRELLKKYDVFMADARILPMMNKSLGRDFLKAKKHPIPVNVTRKSSLPFNILKALRSTYLHLSEGDCVVVRAGYTNMPSNHLVDNVMAVLKNGVPQIPRKWANIRALAVKTPNSTSLPFYNKSPADLAEIARLSGIEVLPKNESKSSDEKKNEDEDTGKEESPRKRKAVKSPLLEALKKQKKGSNPVVEKEKVAEEVVTPTEKIGEDSKKKRKKSEKLQNKEGDKTPEKKQTLTTKKELNEKRDFMPSPSFKGSKSGYVFRKGPKGLGYYVDIKPIPDKAALAALARMSQKTTTPNKRRSTKKGKGGRRSF